MKTRIFVLALTFVALIGADALAQSVSPPREQPRPETIAEPCADDAACEAALERQRLAEEAEVELQRARRLRPDASIDRLPRCPNAADPRCPTGDPQVGPRQTPAEPQPQPN